MKTNVALLLLAVFCFCFAACATPEATAGAIAAVGASATALIQAMAPLLPPETLAKLQVAAAGIDGTVQATATAVATLADAIANLKTASAAQFAQAADGLQKATTAIAELPSREEVYGVTAGTGAVSTAAARLLSRFKHARGAHNPPVAG